MRLFIFILMQIAVIAAAAQGRYTVSGTVSDSDTSESLPAATVCLLQEAAGAKERYTTSDTDGHFTFTNVTAGTYTVKVTYVGYSSFEKKIKVKDRNVTVKAIMREDAMLLGEVSVNARATRAEQKSDSLIYNAEAFKVIEGSNAEDLLAKMPGIVVEGGTIQAQGEDVKKVLVDGKEFFDGDINLAIKNLPSDIIANIEIFDKKSEQAEFTGFDDGEEVKTINIVTKTGFNQGTFGRVYGGYGTDSRYNAGGNINFFNNDRRISILGLSNNVNNVNFSQEDIAGVMSASNGRGGKRGGGRSGTNPNDYMVTDNGGITSSNAIGINYSDQWNDKMKFTGSYFFNQSANNRTTDKEREYFEAALQGMTYEEYTEAKSENFNHRFNMKYEYNIDRNNSLIITPRLSFQNNSNNSFMTAQNIMNGTTENTLESNTESDTRAYNISTGVNYRHRFAKPGRTISVMMYGNVSNTDGDTYYDYVNTLTSASETEEKNTLRNDLKKQYSYRGNVTYTESLMKNLQLSASYKISYSDTESEKMTYNRSAATDLYEQLDETLSNAYTSDYLTQSGGLGLRYNKGKFMAVANADFQFSSLAGEQSYPFSDVTDKNFFAVLPSMTMRYRVDRSNSFDLRYRSSSSSPLISQLQRVIDNSNPLFISAGNPGLKQQVNHMANLRYVKTTGSGQTFIAMIGMTMRQNYVADSTFIASEDIQLSETVTLNKGAQFTRPVNLDGYTSLQSMVTYGFPADFIRSNINLSLSANYASIPTIFNGITSKTKELNIIPKIIIGSNISESLDFTVSYSASFNSAYGSADTSSDDRYTSHYAQAKLGWIFWKGFTLQSTCSYTGYTGLGEDNFNYYLWNVSLGKKFLKGNAAEVKIEAFDILQQNKAFSRNVGSNYYEYVTNNVLQPYIMLSFVYTIR